MIDKDGNGKSQTQTSSFLLKLICSASNVLLNGSVALKISSTESYHCCLFTTSNVKQDLGLRDSKIYDSKIRIRRILNYAGLPSKESELFFLKILNSEGFEDSE